METAGSFERRYSLKPKWVNLINLSSGKSQKAVQASFTKCSCGKAQAIVYVTQSRNPDEATRVDQGSKASAQAAVNQSDDGGRSPIAAAQARGNSEIVSILKHAGARDTSRED